MVKIVLAGDFCPIGRVEKLIEDNNSESILSDIRGIVSKSDYSIVNYEAAITDGSYRAVYKAGPNLQSRENALRFIANSGFKCLTLANNHFLDYGAEALIYSIQQIEKNNIDYVGVLKNINSSGHTLYKTIKGISFAIINCCEHEFSIATQESFGCNPIDPVRQYYEISEAKKIADKVIIIVHGGHEFYNLPSPRMQRLYRFFIDSGADVVINHHQHCYSGYEEYKDGLIFYGIGNFCFDKVSERNSFWNEGILLELTFNAKKGVDFVLHPFIQCSETPSVKLMSEEMKLQFYEKIKILNSIIINPDRLREEHSKWVDSNKDAYEMALFPFKNRILRAFARRGIISNYMFESVVLRLVNFIDCESHRERLLRVLKTHIKSYDL